MTKDNSNLDLYFGYDRSLHEAQLLVGDPRALAYEWIIRYAASISDPNYDDGTVTAEELIETGHNNSLRNPDERISGYITRGGLLEGVSVDYVFWDKLAIFLEKEIPQDRRNNFFSCYC